MRSKMLIKGENSIKVHAKKWLRSMRKNIGGEAECGRK